MYIFIIHTLVYESKCLVMVQYDNQEIANDISNSLRIVATVSEFLEDDLVVNYAGDKLRANGISITNKEISDGLSVNYSNSSLNITVKFRHKYAINDFPLIPSYAFLDYQLIPNLPNELVAQTGLDALTHASKAIKLIFDDIIDATFTHDPKRLENMLIASYKTGRAF